MPSSRGTEALRPASWGNQNELFAYIMKILRGLGEVRFCSLPIMSSLKGILVCPLKKRKKKKNQQSTRTVRKLFVGLLLIFHEAPSALSIRS